jgi:hypothetical protein
MAMNRISVKRIILALAVLVVFGRTVVNDWVDWDDLGLICRNVNLNPPTVSGLIKHWNPKDESNVSMFDPLVFTTWWCLAHVARLDVPDTAGTTLNPMDFHLASLGVHILVTLVVLEILRRLGMRDGPALAGAMLFAIHPIQTEAVAWATAMKDLLSGLFAMIALWRYIIAAETAEVRRRRINYALASAAFLAALLSKPSTVVVPLMALAIDIIWIRRSWRQALLWLAPWFVLSLGFTLLASAVQPTNELLYTPLWARPLIAADALAFYLYKLVAPIHLCLVYGRTPHAVLSDPHHCLYWTWIVPVAIAALLWRLKQRTLTTAGILFLIGVLPVLGLITFVFQYFSTVADRYTYLSMLGAALALAWVVQRYGGKLTTVVLVCVFITLGSLSFAQAGLWKDSITLFTHNLQFNHNFARGYTIRGEYQYAQASTEAKLAGQARTLAERDDHLAKRISDLQEAVKNYRMAVQLDPWAAVGYDDLSDGLIQLDRYSEAAAVLQDAITRWSHLEEWGRPDLASLHLTLALVYKRMGQDKDMIWQLQESLKLRDDSDVRKRLADAQAQPAASRPSTR